jgi:hypothetical protein
MQGFRRRRRQLGRGPILAQTVHVCGRVGVQLGARQLFGAAGQVIVGAVDHVDRCAHVARKLEDREPCRKGQRRERVAEIVDPASR